MGQELVDKLVLVRRKRTNELQLALVHKQYESEGTEYLNVQFEHDTYTGAAFTIFINREQVENVVFDVEDTAQAYHSGTIVRNEVTGVTSVVTGCSWHRVCDSMGRVTGIRFSYTLLPVVSTERVRTDECDLREVR